MYAAFVFSQNATGASGTTDLQSSKPSGDGVRPAGSGQGHNFFSGLLNAAMNPPENSRPITQGKEAAPASEPVGETLSRLMEKLEQLLGRDGVSPELLEALELSEDSPEAGALEALLLRFLESLEQMEALLAQGDLPESAAQTLQELAQWLNALENGADFSKTAAPGGGDGKGADQTTVSPADAKAENQGKTQGTTDANPSPQTQNKADFQKNQTQNTDDPVRWVLDKNQAAGETGEAKSQGGVESAKSQFQAAFSETPAEAGPSGGPAAGKLLIKGLDLLASGFSGPELQPETPAKDAGTLKADGTLKDAGALNTETPDPSSPDKKGKTGDHSPEKTVQTRLASESKPQAEQIENPEKNTTDSTKVSLDLHEKPSAAAPVEDGGGAEKSSPHQDLDNKVVSQGQTPSQTDTVSRTKASEESVAPAAGGPKMMDQIVEKASLMVKEGRHEMVVELKPEVLGRLRMELSLEHHHLNVKMMAESPAVRDMIQQNLPQLRAELQSQGLDVDRVDVHAQNERDNFAGNRGTGDSKGQAAENRFSLSLDENEDLPDAGVLSQARESQNPNGRISYFV